MFDTLNRKARTSRRASRPAGTCDRDNGENVPRNSPIPDLRPLKDDDRRRRLHHRRKCQHKPGQYYQSAGNTDADFISS
jgi:hypothetical protein